MYVFDETLRFLEIPPPSFFFELFRRFGGGGGWLSAWFLGRLFIASIKPSEYARPLLSTPSARVEHFLIWCLWSDPKSRIYARIGIGTLHSYLINLESKSEAVLSAVMFNYCANIDCLHFPGNAQILELGSYAHGDEPNLKTTSHCILDMRTIGVEWVECV